MNTYLPYLPYRLSFKERLIREIRELSRQIREVPEDSRAHNDLGESIGRMIVELGDLPGCTDQDIKKALRTRELDRVLYARGFDL